MAPKISAKPHTDGTVRRSPAKSTETSMAKMHSVLRITEASEVGRFCMAIVWNTWAITVEPTTRYPMHSMISQRAHATDGAAAEQHGAPDEFHQHQCDRIETPAHESDQHQVQGEEERADDGHGVTETHVHEFVPATAAERHETDAERAYERGDQMLPVGTSPSKCPDDERHHYAIRVGEEAVAPR